MANGNGHARIDATRPAKARRAARRAMRDEILSTQIESLGGAVDDAVSGSNAATLEAIVPRLSAIESRLARLEMRLLGIGGLAFVLYEVSRYAIEHAAR